MILTPRQILCCFVLFLLFLGGISWSIYRAEAVRETQEMAAYAMGRMSRQSDSFAAGYSQGYLEGIRVGQRNFRYQDPGRKHKTGFDL